MAIAETVCDDYEARGLTGRPIFWRQDKKRILADLLTFLEADSAYRIAHDTRPIEAELAFGFPKDLLGAVALDLPDGRQVQFRGKADRVDVAGDGTLHVVDYKTGKVGDYKDLSEDNPDGQGRRLQLPVYGEAARQSQGAPDATVRAEYWFVSTRGNFERVGYSVTPEVLEHVGATLSSIVAGDRSGSISAPPDRNQYVALGGVPVLRSRRHGGDGAPPAVRSKTGRPGHGRLREPGGPGARGLCRCGPGNDPRCLIRRPSPRPPRPISRLGIGSRATSTPPSSSKPERDPGRRRP